MKSRNDELFEKSQRLIPGGVNSPVRAFRSVGGTPRFITHGKGPVIWDADGRGYVDYVGSWGPMILGHAHPEVVRAVQEAAAQSLSFGAPTEREYEMAALLTQALPSMEMLRLVSSGTEATMTAIRLARGFTNRNVIIKFEGCYHGHADALLVKAGSGLLTFGQPSSAGVPAETTQHTLVLDYNDVAGLEQAFATQGKEIAGVIIEPVVGNMNLVNPSREFIDALQTLTKKHGALLIFDEVMTGFRVGARGAQGLFGVTPDLTTLGKVIGGGMPLAAFGGRREIMEKMSPLGPVYQAGTLSGNPIAVAAGLATMKLVLQPGFFESLGAVTQSLITGLVSAARAAGVPFSGAAVGGMFGIFFRDQLPTTYAEVMKADKEKFNRFFHLMLERGVYLAPSAFEAGFVSSSHTAKDIELTVGAAADAFKALR